MNLSIDKNKYLILSAVFILFTVIGTISHELGHIAVAKGLGYKTSLHYGYMNFDDSELKDQLTVIYDENKIAIDADLDFEGKDEYEQLSKTYRNHLLLVRIGGPLQTMLTGLIGFFILLRRRTHIEEHGLQFLDWLAVFLALFWLRQVFNLIHSVMYGITGLSSQYFGGDELLISWSFSLPSGVIPITTGVAGLLISGFVLFKVIPGKLRQTFILSGLTGGVSGFVIWMYILGPLVLP